MVISVRLNTQDEKLFKSYAKTHNMSLSDLVRNAVFEKIEDEYDLNIYREALKEYNNNPIHFSHSEVCEILEIK